MSIGRPRGHDADAVLAAAGADPGDIVDMTTHHTDMADFGGFMAVKGEFLTGAAPPAWTAVGVPALALPGQLIEIKVVALVRP